MQESIVFLVRVQCRRKESSRSLSHPLMSFLFIITCMSVMLSEESIVFHLFMCVCVCDCLSFHATPEKNTTDKRLT